MMDSPLFMPLDIGTIRLRHRVVMAPLTRMRSEQPGDVSGDLMAEYRGDWLGQVPRGDGNGPYAFGNRNGLPAASAVLGR